LRGKRNIALYYEKTAAMNLNLKKRQKKIVKDVEDLDLPEMSFEFTQGKVHPGFIIHLNLDGMILTKRFTMSGSPRDGNSGRQAVREIRRWVNAELKMHESI
jgi:hypothetical protein